MGNQETAQHTFHVHVHAHSRRVKHQVSSLSFVKPRQGQMLCSCGSAAAVVVVVLPPLFWNAARAISSKCAAEAWPNDKQE